MKLTEEYLKEIFLADKKSEGNDFKYLEFIISQLQEGLIIVDNDDRILYVNDIFAKMLGYSKDDLIGKIGYQTIILEKDIELIIQKNSDRQKGKSEQYELDMRRKDGSIINLLVHASSLYDGNNTVVGSIATCIDISERKIFEKELIDKQTALVEKEYLLNESQKIAKIGSYVLDLESGFWTSSDALNAVFGIPPDFDKSINGWIELLHPDSKEFMVNYFNDEVIIKRNQFNVKYKILRHIDKQTRWVHGVGQLITDDTGKLKKMIGTIQDITEKKIEEEVNQRLFDELIEAQSMLESNLYQKNSLIEELTSTKTELQKINAEKDRFFSIIAHDLKNAFAGFLNFTKMFAEELHMMTLAEMTELSKNMQTSANSLYKLLENLLEWSRVKRKAVKFNPEFHNINLIIKQLADIFKMSALQKGITLLNNFPEDVNIYVDMQMLNTILRNIIQNAIKFTQKGGFIEINYSSDDKYDSIIIKDNGIGMDKTIKDNIFGFDKKVTREGTEGEPSTGLGLLLCKEFVDIHNGKITVESEVGEGSTFFVSFPKFQDA